MALHFFKATLGESELHLQLKKYINKHMNNLREINRQGPSEPQFAEYHRAMRRDRRWALIEFP